MMAIKIFLIIFVISNFGIVYLNSQEVMGFIENIDEAIEQEEPIVSEALPLTVRTLFMPTFSYELISFNDVRFQNIHSGMTVTRFNLPERDRLFSASLFYRPTIISNTPPNYPELYHNAGVSLVFRANQHSINMAFIARTDKPLYGGLDTFAGFLGYSNRIVNREHFSLALGLNLVVMNFGAELFGIPWLLWPLPTINASWEYEWLDINLSAVPPLARLTVAPRKPVSLIASFRIQEYGIAIWYRHFMNGYPSRELFGIGAGIKNTTRNVSAADDGKRYGINYNVLYGSIRLFRLFDISGGWTFNGREGYGDRRLASSDFNRNIGEGFFVSASARILF